MKSLSYIARVRTKSGRKSNRGQNLPEYVFLLLLVPARTRRSAGTRAALPPIRNKHTSTQGKKLTPAPALDPNI